MSKLFSILLSAFAFTGLSSRPALSAQAPNQLVNPRLIDSSVSPCDDFYQHACGQWLKDYQLPNDEVHWAYSFSELDLKNKNLLKTMLEAYQRGEYSGVNPDEKLLGAYYASCMSPGAINSGMKQELAQELEKISDINDADSFARYGAHTTRLGLPFVFSFSVDSDMKNASIYGASLSESGLGLEKEYFTSDEAYFKKIRLAYQNYIQKMLILIGYPESQSRIYAQKIIQLKIEMAKKALSSEAYSNPDNLYHPTKKSDLAKMWPHFSWNTYFQDLSLLPSFENLNVINPEFHLGVDQILAQNNWPLWRAFLKFHLVDSWAGQLTPVFANTSFDFYGKVLRGQKQQKPRWKRCLSSVNNVLGEVLGKSFVGQTFSPETKTSAQALIHSIFDSFSENLDTLQWLDSNTRAQALQKMKQIVAKIGYPDKWTDFSKLELSSQHHLRNFISLTRWWNEKALVRIGKPVDRSEWFMSPQDVNAYYNPSMNEIVFPAAILQYPMFSSAAPLEQNLGSIGAIMGHELSHGFDSSGAKFDEAGNFRNWWTTATQNVFTEKTQCLINQFNSYEALPGVHLNGALTINENIADLGGVKMALKSVEKHLLSNPQLSRKETLKNFFLAFAQSFCEKSTDAILQNWIQSDPHSPGRFRVNGVVVNTPAFAEAFECSPQAAMVSKNRCEVW